MSAHVKSVDSIRRFRGDLTAYRDSLRHALDILQTELVRTIDYFESDRAAYWPAQMRLADDQVASARIQLERRQITTNPGEGPSCVEEKKALERAKRRLLMAHEKVKVTRKWIRAVRQEVDEVQTRLAPLRYGVDAELPRALQLLERLASRLDRYLDRAGGQAGPEVTPPR